MTMMINGKDYPVHPLFKAEVQPDQMATGFIELDPISAYRIINGPPIPSVRTIVEVKRIVVDEKGQPVQDDEGKPIIETITDWITSIKIGILTEEKEL